MSSQFARTFEWRFESEPDAVWTALADTQRFNEAAGLPKHRIREEPQPDGSVRFFAAARHAGLRLEWEEIPVEWVDRQWFRHLRVFSRGPLRELCATLRLEPEGDGNSLVRYTVEATPANPIGRLLLSTMFFGAVERNFSELVESVRLWTTGRRTEPFPARPATIPASRRARIETIVARIEATPNGHGLARKLADWILRAQEVDLMRIRPIALARRWDAEPRTAVELCLQAVREGMLELRWDLLCPRCRGAKLTSVSLDQLPEGAHCDTCNISYQREFSRNVELTFRPSPSIREVVEGEFCLFGPMSTPHVKVQATVEAGAERCIPADLPPGAYRLRTLEAGGASDFEYEGMGFPTVVAAAPSVEPADPAAPGTVKLENREPRRLTFVIESREWVRDALTADRATSLQAFRDLFSDQVLRPGDDVGVGSVTLMFTDLKGSTALYERIGDAAAYRLVREHFAFLAGTVRRHSGAVVKTIGDAVMAAFADPADAVRAAVVIQEEVASFNAGSEAGAIMIKMGLHAGPCIGVTLNDRLDYFGGAVNMAARLQQQSEGGDIVLSEAVAADPGVAALLSLSSSTLETRTLKGFDRPVSFHRFAPGRAT